MNDYMIRATAAQGKIRAFAAATRDLAEEARQRHNTSPVVTAALGRLLTAGVMMGSMMKGDQDKLTLKVEGDGPVKALTVTADSQGQVKGFPAVSQVLLHANAQGKLDVAGAVGIGVLTVIKDLGLREPYVGTCILTTSEIAEDLTYYFATSEQVPSSVALGVLMEKNNTVRQAGGFILQLMPDVDDATITQLEQKIASITSITSMLDQGMAPEQILEYVLGDFSMEILDRMPVSFRCDCSKEKVRGAIVTLGRKDLEELAFEKEAVEVHCDFCNTSYWFQPEELREMLDAAPEEPQKTAPSETDTEE